jgi:hypothetical protein
MKILLPLLAAAVLAGCNTPYPNGSPIVGAEVSANPNRRGSEAFCRDYARQTAGNRYESDRDSGDSFGSNAMARQQALRAGDAAYERCRRGRTG